MSLNNLILPDVLVSSLYKNNLIEIKEGNKNNGSKETIDPLPQLQFLGKHLQQITVFVNYPDEVYLPDVQLNFLANILKACNLNIADIAIVNLARQQVLPEHIDTALKSKKIIFFDVDTAVLAIADDIPLFSVKQHGETYILKGPALEKLNQANEEGKLLKSKLWLCLKELFSVR
jgi:hypothetical protein